MLDIEYSAKVTYLENLSIIVNTMLTLLDNRKWVIKSIVTYSNSLKRGSKGSSNPRGFYIATLVVDVKHKNGRIFALTILGAAIKSVYLFEPAIYENLNALQVVRCRVILKYLISIN